MLKLVFFRLMLNIYVVDDKKLDPHKEDVENAESKKHDKFMRHCMVIVKKHDEKRA